MKLVNGAPSSGDDPERSEAGQPRDGEILERGQEKWEPVLRPDARQDNGLERDDHSKRWHPALEPAGGALQQTALAGVAAPERGAHGLARCLPPAAPFLAQLIATAQQAPQTRARRRAEPADAVALYAVAHQAPTRDATRPGRAEGRNGEKSWLM
jgi:hypothetical protein